MKKIILIFFTIVIVSCEEESYNVQLSSIKYGTSFGQCLGYCITNIELTGTEIVKTTSGWNNSVIPETIIKQVLHSNYTAIEAAIDQNRFIDMEPVIGCPDCADGGSEWIEIDIDGRVKKVTFEYGSNPEGLSEVLEELRRLNVSMTK